MNVKHEDDDGGGGDHLRHCWARNMRPEVRGIMLGARTMGVYFLFLGPLFYDSFGSFLGRLPVMEH